MSNTTTLQTNNNKLSANNTDLTTILNTINNLPEAGSGSEDLSSELNSQDGLLTEQINKLNNVVTALAGKASGGSGGIIPSGTIFIEENDVYDVTNYATAVVTVPTGYPEGNVTLNLTIKSYSSYCQPIITYHEFSHVAALAKRIDISSNTQTETIQVRTGSYVCFVVPDSSLSSGVEIRTKSYDSEYGYISDHSQEKVGVHFIVPYTDTTMTVAIGPTDNDDWFASVFR